MTNINIGRNIEVAIQSMMKVSEEVANIQASLEASNNDFNILETLFSVSKYIGSNPEQHIIMSMLEDSIKGIFGASYCQVLFEKNKTHLSNSTELYNHLDYYQLTEQVSDILVIDDVVTSDITDLECGSLIIVPLSVGDDLYGFLTSYWEVNHNMNPSNLLFLQIISSQVSMFLKSNTLVEEFKAIAVNDALTGLYNKSYFINITENTKPTLGESIVMFDIDNFKKINDKKGHQFGDKVLARFAEIATECSNEIGGTSFRYGGEEFIVKCNGGEKVAVDLGEKIRRTFYEKTGYTVSGGICTLGENCRIPDYNKMVKHADSALYVSKECGRNKVTKSSGDIQILQEGSIALTQMLSKAYRKLNNSTIFRLKARGDFLVSAERYSKLETEVGRIGRLYDNVFMTDSLDVLVVLDGKVESERFISRARKKLNDVLNDVDYDAYSLQSVFNEVIVHSSRVSELAQILAWRLGFEQDRIDKVRIACEWHDLGKLCIDPAIYNKKGKLNDEEFEVIKMHSWLSYLIAANNPTLTSFAEWVLYHHEDFNGTGYYKLAGNDIPLEAQVISIIDKFDALTEDRCYRPAFSWEDALEILIKEKDKFDENLFIEFINMVNDLMLEK